MRVSYMPIKNQKNESVFFSIITPNYNSGEKLLRAIESLKINTVSYEHIIIDDCSTDDSFSFVEKLKCNNSKSNLIFLSNSSNSGPGVSRNKGLEFAKGKYVIFLDADDYFLDGALDTLYSEIKSKDKVDVLLFDYHLMTDSSKEKVFVKATNGLVLIDNPIREYLLDKIISSPWCKCIEAGLAKRFRFSNLRVGEDALYNLDIFMDAENVFKLSSTLYIFDKTDDNSLTRKEFDKKELLKFHKSWVFFERKALRDLDVENQIKLIASRKIKFCVAYYISRLVVSPSNNLDRFIVGSVRKIFFDNIYQANSYLSMKLKVFCILFCFTPASTIKLSRILKIF